MSFDSRCVLSLFRCYSVTWNEQVFSTISDPFFFIGMFTHTFMRELKRYYTLLCSLCKPRDHSVYRAGTRSRSSSHKRHQHVLLQQSVPFMNRAKCCSTNGPYSAPPRCPVQALMCTTCAIAISSDSDNPIFHMRIQRQLTPPHIAEGKGHTHEFDKYILL